MLSSGAVLVCDGDSVISLRGSRDRLSSADIVINGTGVADEDFRSSGGSDETFNDASFESKLFSTGSDECRVPEKGGNFGTGVLPVRHLESFCWSAVGDVWRSCSSLCSGVVCDELGVSWSDSSIIFRFVCDDISIMKNWLFISSDSESFVLAC